MGAPLLTPTPIPTQPRWPARHAINLVKPMLDVRSFCVAHENLGRLGILGSSGTGASDSDLQRAHGTGEMVLAGSDRGTCIVDVFQRSPLRIMFPRSGGRAIGESVLVNTAGGVAGGGPVHCCRAAPRRGSHPRPTPP